MAVTTPINTTFDTRFAWAANAEHHSRDCDRFWENACRSARALTAAHTHNERMTAAGRLQTSLMFLSKLTGVPEDVLAEAVDEAA